MRDVVEQLRSYAEATERAVPEPMPLRRERRARVWVLPVAAVMVIIAGVVGAIVFRYDEDDPSTDVRSGAGQTSASAPLPAGGRWDSLPAAPIAGRVGHVMVATDQDLIVWGGRRADQYLGDGAAWSFGEHRWRSIPRAPLPPRSGALAVWTGRELVVLGGVTAGGNARDAAAYDPGTDRWRRLPDAPFDATEERSSAAWTGSELVVAQVEPRANEFLPSDTYALDPDSGGWRPAAPMPDHPGPRPASASRAIWTGSQLLVVSIAELQPVTVDRYDPATDRWGPTISTPVDGLDLDPHAIAWTGQRLVLAGSNDRGAAVDPATGAVDALDGSGSSARYPAQAVGGVVTIGDRYLGSDGRWRDAAEVLGSRELPATAVHDGQLYVWGGSGCPPGASCAGFVDSAPVGLVWTPPAVQPGAPSGSTTTTAPAVSHGRLPVDVSGVMTCDPTDATAVELTLRSDEDRSVFADVVQFRESGTVHVGGPRRIELAAGETVTEFVTFTVPVDEVQTAANSVTVRLTNADGTRLVGAIVPVASPHCG